MVLPSRVEERVGVIDEAEQHGDRLFRRSRFRVSFAWAIRSSFGRE